jgi:hypothetical protein
LPVHHHPKQAAVEIDRFTLRQDILWSNQETIRLLPYRRKYQNSYAKQFSTSDQEFARPTFSIFQPAHFVTMG